MAEAQKMRSFEEKIRMLELIRRSAIEDLINVTSDFTERATQLKNQNQDTTDIENELDQALTMCFVLQQDIRKKFYWVSGGQGGAPVTATLEAAATTTATTAATTTAAAAATTVQTATSAAKAATTAATATAPTAAVAATAATTTAATAAEVGTAKPIQKAYDYPALVIANPSKESDYDDNTEEHRYNKIDDSGEFGNEHQPIYETLSPEARLQGHNDLDLPPNIREGDSDFSSQTFAKKFVDHNILTSTLLGLVSNDDNLAVSDHLYEQLYDDRERELCNDQALKKEEGKKEEERKEIINKELRKERDGSSRDPTVPKRLVKPAEIRGRSNATYRFERDQKSDPDERYNGKQESEGQRDGRHHLVQRDGVKRIESSQKFIEVNKNEKQRVGNDRVERTQKSNEGNEREEQRGENVRVEEEHETEVMKIYEGDDRRRREVETVMKYFAKEKQEVVFENSIVRKDDTEVKQLYRNCEGEGNEVKRETEAAQRDGTRKKDRAANREPVEEAMLQNQPPTSGSKRQQKPVWSLPLGIKDDSYPVNVIFHGFLTHRIQIPNMPSKIYFDEVYDVSNIYDMASGCFLIPHSGYYKFHLNLKAEYPKRETNNNPVPTCIVRVTMDTDIFPAKRCGWAVCEKRHFDWLSPSNDVTASQDILYLKKGNRLKVESETNGGSWSTIRWGVNLFILYKPSESFDRN